MIKSSIFARASIRHGYFTRKGGVSDGIYGSLNCGAGSSDRAENVVENKRLLMRGAPPLREPAVERAASKVSDDKILFGSSALVPKLNMLFSSPCQDLTGNPTAASTIAAPLL